MLRRRLGGSANLVKPFPERPKGMRYQTYERLRRQAEELEAAYVAVMVDELRLAAG